MNTLNLISPFDEQISLEKEYNDSRAIQLYSTMPWDQDTNNLSKPRLVEFLNVFEHITSLNQTSKQICLRFLVELM